MKTARFYGIHDVRFEDRPLPECGADQVLIKVAYSGICGSDLHIYNKGMFVETIPETMGHEFSGTIVEAGKNVKDFKAGDKVVANPMVTCMECPSCQAGSYNTCDALGFIGEVCQGCFAEYIAMPEDTLIRVPDDASLRLNALAEPMAVVMNVIERACLNPDEKLAIIGAGPIGILTMIAARDIAGVKDITIVNRSNGRLEIAKAAGAENAVNALPEGILYDKIIETAGKAQSLENAVNHVKAGGSVYVLSIFEDEFPSLINTIVGRQISVVGCNAYEKRHIAQAVDVISTGKVNISPVISGEYPLEECAEAFKVISSNGRSVAKLLFNINGEEE